MSKASKKKSRTSVAVLPERIVDRWPVLGPAILVAMTLACYWIPMTSSQTSIQWDAADQFQVAQNYLSQELHAGRIPFWTPCPWSGYPFLADPQVGAWYPLNWPFFLIGVPPRVLVVEHWLHALLACFGAYFLALRLLRRHQSAVLAGLCYGLSGFFVDHGSHTTMLQCAAWMPWLLLLLHRGARITSVAEHAPGWTRRRNDDPGRPLPNHPLQLLCARSVCRGSGARAAEALDANLRNGAYHSVDRDARFRCRHWPRSRAGDALRPCFPGRGYPHRGTDPLPCPGDAARPELLRCFLR